MATLDGNEDGRKICPDCNGNGYVRIPYHLAKEEIWANCDKCDSQGEIERDQA